jgi:signal transduction histidine kinase
MFRQNFRGRLFVGALLWITIGLGFSGFVLSAIFREVVVAQFDHDLSDHAEELAGNIAIDAQHGPIVNRDLSDPRFLPARSGVYWQVDFNDGSQLRSPSLDDDLRLPAMFLSQQIQPTVADGPTGPLRFLQRTLQPRHLAEPVRVSLGVDERLIDAEMRQLNFTLMTSLAIIAVGLFVAACAQIAFGLQPLVRIRHAVAAVRSGSLKQLPDDLPAEVRPLVTELNGMIAANASMVERARLMAGNFAHALKLPLAILIDEANRLEQQGYRDAARVLMDQCKRINLQIDYQTARARTSALANAGTSTRPVPVIRTVFEAHARLAGGSHRSFQLNAPVAADDLVVACDPNDLTELIGNLIDNAAKWSLRRVVVTVLDLDDAAQIMVDDDGPGIPFEDREAVFEVGMRLDDDMPGSGLGLAIARDLATLYGGRVWIERSCLGGASACVTLNKVPQQRP